MKLKFIALLLILLSPAAEASVDDFDFDFSVTGDRSVRPIQVFTDGEKTYFQFRNSQNPPTMIARGRVVRYSIEAPYVVVVGLDDLTTLVGQGGRDKGEVKYNGNFSPTKLAIQNPNLSPTQKSVAVTSYVDSKVVTGSIEPKVMPETKVANTAYVPQSKSASQVKQEFTGEFVFFPSKPQLNQVNAKALMPGESLVAPTSLEPANTGSLKSMFVKENASLSKGQVDTLVAHATSGGVINLQGSSSGVNQLSRIELANARANNAKKELIERGIPAAAIRVQQITNYPNTKDVAGVSITLTKGSST